MYFLYNNNYEDQNKRYGVLPNPIVKKSLSNLSKVVNLEPYRKYIDLFFNEKVIEDKLTIGLPVEGHMLCAFSNIDEFILYLKNMSNEEFISIIIKCIDNISRDLFEIKKILYDKETTITLLHNLHLRDEFKWQLIELISNVDIYKQNYINFITYFYPLYIGEIEQNKKHIDKFRVHFEKMIKDNGKTYIENLLSCNLDGLNLCIGISFYGNFAVQKQEYKKTVYLLLGIDAEQIYNNFNDKNKNKNMINIYKNLSDVTRFDILKIIFQNNSITMQELANILNVSVPTIKYHIDSLLLYNLVLFKKTGNKNIYEINKKMLSDSVNYLIKEFNL